MIRKGKTCITAIFYSTDLVICSHSRERKTLSYIDTVYDQYDHCQMVITISWKLNENHFKIEELPPQDLTRFRKGGISCRKGILMIPSKYYQDQMMISYHPAIAAMHSPLILICCGN